jgi:hypothetical protein
MLDAPDQTFGRRFMDPFVAAVPQSLLLRESFELMLTYIREGIVPYDKNFNLIYLNPDLNVRYTPNSFELAINLILYKYRSSISHSTEHVCAKYGMQRTKAENVAML